ncbi:putative WD40/YVTN repeat-like-containing domain superfamily [Septoria linicola]|nr:putative WD40/YVTN repeat-like-containing domain superfamily [Septoria linicola]
MHFSALPSTLALLVASATAAAIAVAYSSPEDYNGHLPEYQRLWDRQTSNNDKRFTFFPLKTPAAGPCDLEKGPDGALWGEGILDNIIFRIDPHTGVVEEYPIPFTTPASNQTIPGVPRVIAERGVFSCAIRRGADGNLYAANGLRNQLVRINPTTREIEVFQPPGTGVAGNLQPFNDLYTSDDGMWYTQTTGNVFQKFDYKSEKFETFKVPTPFSLPLGIFVASDKKVYVAELLGNKILVLDRKKNKIEEYPLPEPLQFPAVIRAERKGFVYFSLVTGNGIGRINMKTHKIDIFHTNKLAGLGAEDTIDKYGGVYLSFFNVNALARLNTDTLKYSYIPFPRSIDLPAVDVPPYVDVAVNYGPGDAVWFTDVSGNRVGRYDISGLYG